MNHHLEEWQRIRSEAGPNLKLFQTRYDFMRNPRNGHVEPMIILESTDSVNVVAVTPEEELVFVHQYRFGIGRHTLELPGGIVDPGEDHQAGAARELREETGFSGDNWEYLGKVASNPVFMDSYIHHWLVRDVKITFDPQLDGGESVEVVRMPVAEARQQWLQGAFEHPHTVNGLLLFFGKYHF